MNHIIFIFYILILITGISAVLLYSIILKKFNSELLKKFILLILSWLLFILFAAVLHYCKWIINAEIYIIAAIQIILYAVFLIVIYFFSAFFHYISESGSRKHYIFIYTVTPVLVFTAILLQVFIFNFESNLLAVISERTGAIVTLLFTAVSLYCLFLMICQYGKIQNILKKKLIYILIVVEIPLIVFQLLAGFLLFTNNDLFKLLEYFLVILSCPALCSVSIAYFIKFFNRMIDIKDIFKALPEPFIKNHGITPRENEIISLLLENRQYSEISSRLSISVKTVEAHIGNIYKKLSVSSKEELANLTGK